jgi:hypothetical protein
LETGAISTASPARQSAFQRISFFSSRKACAIKSQVNDGPITVYTAGQNFAELPGDHHRVSENASATEPARLLAVFVVDTAETNLVIDDAP